MRLLSRLEYERSFGARWVTYFVRIPKLVQESASSIELCGVCSTPGKDYFRLLRLRYQLC